MTPFFRRRTIWVPTWLGCLTLLAGFAVSVIWWWFRAESFFSLTERQPEEVLIVEGWIGIEGVTAAKEEFVSGNYTWIVTAGSLTGTRWDVRRWNTAIEASKILRGLGVDPARIIEAPAGESLSQRSFAAAEAVRERLKEKGMAPARLNVFTLGVHARRSRLIYAKVLGSPTRVGVIAWISPKDRQLPWWKSSDRAQELLKETVAYPFELLLSSGR